MMFSSSGGDAVPTLKAGAMTPPKATRSRRPATARPSHHPSERAKTAATLSARGAAAVPVGKRGRVARSMMGNSNRQAVAEMAQPAAPRSPAQAQAPPSVQMFSGVGNQAMPGRADDAANAPRLPTDASFAPTVRPQPPVRIAPTSQRELPSSRPVLRPRQPPARATKAVKKGKASVPLFVLSPRQTRRPAPPQATSPPRPEVLAPVAKDALGKRAQPADYQSTDTSSPSPEPDALGKRAEPADYQSTDTSSPSPEPATMVTLSEPARLERPATPASSTPRVLITAMQAAREASRRQALAAAPSPGYRARPQSAPAAQRHQVATDRKGEMREVTVAEPLEFHEDVDRRWASPESTPVRMTNGHDSRAVRRGKYKSESTDGVSGIGLSDKNGLISKIRHLQRTNVLVPALHACDPDHTGTIDAETFHQCLQELDVCLSPPQVQWIFSAFGVDSSTAEGRMHYDQFCAKLHADVRVGMAKNAYETHAKSDKWIFRKEEETPARPLANVETKAVTMLPREGVHHGGRAHGADYVEIAHPRLPVHYTAQNAAWSGTLSVMGRLLRPAESELQTLKANRGFYARGKEGWAAGANIMNFALKPRNCVSKSHKNEKICIQNDEFCSAHGRRPQRKEQAPAGTA